MLALAFNVIVSVVSWAHLHIVTGLNPFVGWGMGVIIATMAIPGVLAIGRRMANLLRSRIRFSPSVLFLFGAFVFLTSSFVSGLPENNPALEAAVVFGVVAAIYEVYPRFSGRYPDPAMGSIHFWFTLIAACLIFHPMCNWPLADMPRRYIDVGYPSSNMLYGWNRYLTTLKLFLVLAQGIFLFNLFHSWKNGREVSPRSTQ
ncbi:MAG TPA: cbb3-type cytochrome c oxidase subunit I [Puia sp.]|nr:cbb3-type cytochrome c oxidase subunit I [Puia sp.]